jgi:hypothetical protein
MVVDPDSAKRVRVTFRSIDRLGGERACELAFHRGAGNQKFASHNRQARFGGLERQLSERTSGPLFPSKTVRDAWPEPPKISYSGRGVENVETSRLAEGEELKSNILHAIVRI